MIMARTVVGLFDSFPEAQEVVQELVNAGIARENISLIANDAEGRLARDFGLAATAADDSEDVAGERGAAKGAGIGATLGGIAGLLLGIGVFLIGGIGPVLIAGPIITTLGGAGIGAVTGGLLGSLTKAGIAEHEAKRYVEGIRRGGTLVVVYTSDEFSDHASEVMNQHHVVNVAQRSQQWNGFKEHGESFAFDDSKKSE
jgi:hypothetical protein